MGRVLQLPQKAANMFSRGSRERPHFVSDAKPAKRLKQGLAAERDSGFESLGNAITTNVRHMGRRGDSDIDEDYAMILNAGINHGDCSLAYIEEGGDGLDTDFAVQDPQHKLFFESVKVYGRSYALEWEKSDGTTYIMEYEDIISVDPLETCTVDKNMTAADNSWKNISDGAQGGKTTRMKLSSSERKRNFTVPKSIPHVYDKHSRQVSNLRMDGKRMIHTSKTGKVVAYEEDELSSSDHFEREAYPLEREVIEDGDDDMDCIFLSNLRMDGEIIVYTSKTGEVLRYGGGQEISSDSDSDTDVMDRDPREGQNRTPYPAMQRKNRTPYPAMQSQNRTPYPAMQRQNRTPYPATQSQNSTPYPAMQRQNRTPYPATQSQNRTPYPAMQRQNRTPYPATQSQNRTPYPAMQSQNRTPYPAMQRQNHTPYPAMQSGTSGNRSDFKEKLFALLQKPYSREEYDDLLQKASYQRKRKRKPKELSHSRKHKSYLDLYPDLRQEIDLARRNRCKVLYLLRGFFYWLMNVPQEEGFVPWLEPSCLEMLPKEADK